LSASWYLNDGKYPDDELKIAALVERQLKRQR